MEFYYSDFEEKINLEEFNAECHELEVSFTKMDWTHLYKHCANNPKKVYYRDKMNAAL